MDKIQLLIIEEHIAVRRALQVRLQSSSNLEVIAACPCTDDWKTEYKKRFQKDVMVPEVVLLGLKTGGNRPFSSTIKDISGFKRAGMAVIVLASFADDVERELFLEAGAERYLLKDINSIQLISEIESLASAQTH